jgi:subtilisin family serine protease
MVSSLIVTYPAGKAPTDDAGKVTGASGLPGVELLAGEPIGFGYYTVDLGKPVSQTEAETLSRRWQQTGQVLQAQPDYPITLSVEAADRVPRAPLSVRPFATQTNAPWGLDRIDQRSGRDGSYRYDTEGRGVTAYILDSGLRATHQQFAGRVAPGASAISDGRGTGDCNGHGTHVAGTLGGTTSGVAKKVKLVPVRVTGCSGSGYTSDVISGLNWIVSHHSYSTPAVLNISLGGPLNLALDQAASRAVADNITVVVASGNSGRNACNYSPAGAFGTITVNAATYPDDDASWSNYGGCTNIYAPGVSISSAGHSSDSALATMSGTSMAAPHVAGAAARILSANPSWTPAQVRDRIYSTATPVNFVPSSASDAKRYLYMQPPVTVPGAPTGLVATPLDRSARVAFRAPASNGGAAIRTYQFSLDDGRTWRARTPVSAASPLVITGLANGTTYRVRLRTVNAAGAGPASAVVVVTPRR